MEIWNECIKCATDFSYFAKTYIKTTNPKRGMIPLDLHPFQKRLCDTYDTKNYVISKKFRQGGFITVTTFYTLWRSLFYQNQKVLIVSKTYKEAEYLAEMVSFAITQFPLWLRSFVSTNTKHSKGFDITGSSMEFFTWEACRSKSLTHLVIDEAAFIKDLDKRWKYMFPTIANGGKCFVTSTVNGYDGWFFDLWHDAVDEKIDFFPFQASYDEHPDYQDKEYCERMRKALGEAAWHQEILADFLIGR